LLQPQVLKSAVIAALASVVVCYPRLASYRVYPLWYLEAILVLGGIVLWGFVFAWHTQYSGRPVFQLKFEPGPFALATLTGIGAALVLRLTLDPGLRTATPTDFPRDFTQWLAMTSFSLGFSQLLLVFAPFAWSLRLFHNRSAAIAVTVLFGVVVLLVKERSGANPLSTALFAGLLLTRIASALWSLQLYLRGGVLLVCWFHLLVLARHLCGL
jgi:hypothetical protein